MKKLLTIVLVLGWTALASAFTYENNPASMTLGAYTGGNTFANISVIGSAYIKETGAGAARISLYHDGSTAHIQTATGSVKIDPALNLLVGSEGTPSLNWGDGDTGIYEYSDDAIGFSFAGSRRWLMFSTGIFYEVGTGPGLYGRSASATIPTITPLRGYADQGFGGGNGFISTIVNDMEALHIDETGNHIMSSNLVAASGNEAALSLNYVVNKAAGNDTGLKINQTDSASPGTSLLADFQVGGVSKAKINNAGGVYGTDLYAGTTTTYGSNQMYTTSGGYILANGADTIQEKVFEFNSYAAGELIKSSGSQAFVSLAPIYNQTGTTANTDLLINRDESLGVGSGTQLLIDAQVGGASKFKVANTGAMTSGLAGSSATYTLSAPSSLTIGSPTIGFSNSAASWAALLTSIELGLRGGRAIGFSPDNSASQVGLDYASAGVIKVTDGSSGIGALEIGNVEVKGAPTFSGWSSIGADYSVDTDVFFIECDATLGNISTTLPPIASVTRGHMIEVKLTSATNGCYIDGNGAETIDGVAGKDITTQWNALSLIAAAAQWFIK